MNNERFRENILSLRNICDTQCSDGNWNYDPYMHGLANGLILAIAIMEDNSDAKYLTAPKVWLRDIPSPTYDQEDVLEHLYTEKELMEKEKSNKEIEDLFIL